MNIDEIMKLIQAVSDYSLTSFELEEGNVKISLKREKEAAQIVTVSGTGVNLAAAVSAPAAASPAQIQATAVAPPELDSDNVVTSPLVGTFYNSASPESEPYVKVGDTIKKGQVLGIIEAMKLMNEIESEYDGVIEAVLVKTEDVVEYGQPLFRIR